MKIFFGIWLARKNYKMRKSEFDKCHRNLATSDCRCQISASTFGRIPIRLFRIWPNPGHFGQIQSDQWPNPSHFGQIQPASDHGQNPAILRPISNGIRSVGIQRRWLNVAGFRRWQVFGNRMLSDSGASWIPTIDNC